MNQNTDNSDKYYDQSILNISDGTKYWFVRAGSNAVYYQDFLVNNYIGAETNKMRLVDLYSMSQSLRSAPSAVLEKYKQLFQEHDLKLFDEKHKNVPKDDTDLKREKRTANIKSTNRANRVFHFVEEMSVGDFVIIPHDHSKKYLIGIVISDCFDQPVNHTDIRTDEDDYIESPGYAISHFEIKRKIYWIKELDQKNFPDKLSWIRTAHQSLFDITEDANYLNPYISPFYLYKGYYYMRFGVNTTGKISSSDWLDYQTLIKNIVGKSSLKNIYQKQKVQSPGDIITFCEQNWHLLVIIGGILFGKIDINCPGINMHISGVLPYFSKSERVARKVKLQEAELDYRNNEIKLNQTENKKEIENKKIQNELNKLFNESKKSVLESKRLDREFEEINKTLNIRNNKNRDKINKLYFHSEDQYDMENNFKDNKVATDNIAQVRDKFKLSDENPGESIPDETQEDNLS